MRENRLEQLQFLRFIAFFLIFILHQHWYWFACKGNFFGCFGIAPVAFFFILSGFLSAFSAGEKDIKLTVGEIFKYMIKKIKKFYPLYFISIIITMCYTSNIAQSIATNAPFHDYKKSVVQLFVDLFLVQSWSETGYFSFNGVGWFLSTIMFLYLMRTPVLSLFCKIKKSIHANKIFAGILVYCVLWIFIYSSFCKGVQEHKLAFWMYIFPPARLVEYIAGMSLGMLVPEFSRFLGNIKNNNIVYTALEILSFGLWAILMCITLPSYYKITLCWIVPALFTLFIFTIGKGYISKIFCAKPLVFLGNISFECFILHQMIMTFYVNITKIETYTFAGKLFSVLYCLFLTLIASSFIYMQKKKN